MNIQRDAKNNSNIQTDIEITRNIDTNARNIKDNAKDRYFLIFILHIHSSILQNIFNIYNIIIIRTNKKNIPN